MKSYDPSQVENRWYDYWVKNHLFSPRQTRKETFTIVMPPPNVTGILHIGHVLNNTLQDILIRYKRMRQFQTLWVPGTDHAGIATQNKVERLIAEEGMRKEDLGRTLFLEKVWAWKEKHGNIIIDQLKRLGCSCDWSRERFTMDPGLSRAVREVFVRLFEKNLIYKGKYIVNLCPRCRTALSDEEVEHETTNGKLWYIHYPAEDGSQGVVVATTRPETMLGDVAVAVHPEDERYRDIIGKHVLLPLQNRLIPVIADEMVDAEFGTGAVKITPAHDANDFEAGLRHSFEPVVIMDQLGIMNEAAGDRYKGMDRFECRKKVVEDLKAAGLLVKIEDYTNAVGYCYRCHTVVEPYLSAQWFVRMKPLAEPAIEAAKKGAVVFYPDRWTKVYLHWLENIRDWCISRQLWWGHRIPVWTCDSCGHFQAYREAPERCPECGHDKLTQDPDVLDTWFSSWLWPFSTLGWPDETDDLKKYYPTSTLITAPEIIFFWVARMIMAGIEFMGEVPFNSVYLHGTVRDGTGRKMSKSLGNSPDPLHIMERVGADALRMSIVMISPRGSDIFFSEESLNVGKTFNNKIWNASRLILQTCPDDSREEGFPEELSLFDRWIMYRLAVANEEITASLEKFRFNEAAIAIHRFIWHEFCDWYLEISKLALYADDSSSRKKRVQQILANILSSALRLLHPFMPFITEEIWHQLHPNKESIMISDWPETSRFLEFKAQAAMVEKVQKVVTAIRTIRSETRIPPSEKISVVLHPPDTQAETLLEQCREEIIFLSRLSQLTIQKDVTPPRVRATTVTPDGVDVYVNLENVVDVPVEIARLKKEIQKVDSELERVEKKLNNPNFMQKAPEDVVNKNKRIKAELNDKKQKLLEALKLFSGE